MSRGRPRGGRGKKAGEPESTWELEPATSNLSHKPEPLFPLITQSLPIPLSGVELDHVKQYRKFRSLLHDGPLYTVLDPSQRTDKHGHLNRRAGFDPFEGMPSYGKRYQKSKRRLPDLRGRPYVLKFFPKELWATLDPKRQNPAWHTLGPLLPDPPGIGTAVEGKQKAVAVLSHHDQAKRGPIDILGENERDGEEEVDQGEEDDNDEATVAPLSQRRAHKRGDDNPSKEVAGQRKGLEAEDDYGPDAERVNEDEPEGEEIAEDSVFEESDDGAGDDYNAENYFDDGEDDDVDEGGGGDDDGGTFLN